MMAPAVALFVAAVTASSPSKLPSAVARSAGEIEIVMPASVMTAAEVRKQLTSGLTTTLFVTVSERGKNVAARRIEIRYELWDETFIVAARDDRGRRDNVTLTSYDRLVEWWSKSGIAIAPSSATGPRTVQVKLDVIPFSASEEADAQRWLSRNVSAAGAPSPTASGSTHAAEPGSSAGGILDLMIGMSVRRRPLLTYQWTVPLPHAP